MLVGIEWEQKATCNNDDDDANDMLRETKKKQLNFYIWKASFI